LPAGGGHTSIMKRSISIARILALIGFAGKADIDLVCSRKNIILKPGGTF